MAKPRFRSVLASLTTLALVPGMSTLTFAAPAEAAPLPAPYTASAHGDLVGLNANLLAPLAPGSLADAKIGHSLSTVDSEPTLPANSVAESANLDASVLFNNVPLPVDVERATAPPTTDPPARALVPLPLEPVASVGLITGDVEAAYTDANSCVPAAEGERVLSDAYTSLAGVTLADLPGVGALATVGASHVRTTTKLVDDAVGGSDVVASTETVVGDIGLLGGNVTVDVSNTVDSPVIVRARSDGTTGSSEIINPPTVTVTAGGTPITIPLNGQPQQITLPAELEPIADLTITAFTPTDQSSGAVGEADLQNLLRIQLKVLSLPAPLGATVADVDLSLAPLHVRAQAPAGGVECAVPDTTAPDAPTITSPVDGSVTNDTTPDISGTGAEEGSTVTVYDTDGTTVLCTDDTVGADGAWSCTPGPMTPGGHTITATSTDGAGNESAPSAPVRFTIDTSVAGDVVILTPADGSSTTDTTPTVSGTTEPGATVTVTENGAPICTAVADSTGAWSCDSVPVMLGSHTFTAIAEDAAGNVSPADTTTFTVVAPNPGDTTPPDAPVITSPADGSSTDDTTPTVSGTAEPGSTVTVTEGTTVICTAVADAAGNWTCTPTTPLAAGSHTLGATATDAAGNTSPADTVTFTVAPGSPDRDDDGLPNGNETAAGTNPDDPDTDNDGLTDGQEVDHDGAGSDKGTGTDPLKADTDGDGLKDGQEVNTTKTDPLDPDTDNDGLKDGPEVLGMTLKERFEVCGKRVKNKIRVTTNALVKDTDKDGLTDGREVKGYRIKQVVFVTRSGDKITIGKTRSNPTKADTDRDRIKDKVEMKGSANKKFKRRKTDPTKCDTDRGGVSDGREIKLGSDPTRITSGPNDLNSRMAGRGFPLGG